MSTTLKYNIIKTEDQYYKYCNIHEKLVFEENDANEDEIELLTLLIEKYDDDHYQTTILDPIEILRSLMKDHKLKAKDLTEILSLSKGTVSKILNYQTGLSKETIRRLSTHFKMNQEAFNRPYKLKISTNQRVSNAAYMNTRKKIKQTA
jgi:HTH-type transcriptional regulator/antitoxin HigA